MEVGECLKQIVPNRRASLTLSRVVFFSTYRGLDILTTTQGHIRMRRNCSKSMQIVKSSDASDNSQVNHSVKLLARQAHIPS